MSDITNADLYIKLLAATRHLSIQTSRFKAPSLNKWAESDTHILISSDENGYLLHLKTAQVTYLNYFFDDPTCALLSQDSQWAVMAANDQITIWNTTGVIEIAFDGAFDMRQISESTIHILIDPMYDNAAIWELNVHTYELKVVRPFTEFKFKDYYDRYTQTVIW